MICDSCVINIDYYIESMMYILVNLYSQVVCVINILACTVLYCTVPCLFMS